MIDYQKIIQNIMFINEKFSDAQWVKAQGADVLSYTALKLSAMKGYLAEFKEDALRNLLKAEREMEAEKSRAFLRAREKLPVTAASEAKNADEQYIKSKEVYGEAKVLYERLKSISADTHDLIDAIKGRTIELQSQRKTEANL